MICVKLTGDIIFAMRIDFKDAVQTRKRLAMIFPCPNNLPL